jgi:hypothetical protein
VRTLHWTAAPAYNHNCSPRHIDSGTALISARTQPIRVLIAYKSRPDQRTRPCVSSTLEIEACDFAPLAFGSSDNTICPTTGDDVRTRVPIYLSRPKYCSPFNSEQCNVISRRTIIQPTIGTRRTSLDASLRIRVQPPLPRGTTLWRGREHSSISGYQFQPTDTTTQYRDHFTDDYSNYPTT